MVLALGAIAWTALQTDTGPLPFSGALEAEILRMAAFAIGFLVVFLVGWFLLEPAVSRVIMRRNRENPTIEEAITRYVRLIIAVGALFVGLHVAGFTGVVGNSALVIAGVSVALGIAGQSVIGSLVSGTALVIDPEFNVGNYIRWDGGEGEVTSITLRVTRVRTPEGGFVTIPNTTLTDEAIFRPFEGNTCRTTERIVIGYGDDIETAIGLLSEVTADIEAILDSPAPNIGVEELGDDGVVLYTEYWIEDPVPSLLPVRSAFIRAAKSRLEAEGFDVGPSAKLDLEGGIRIDGAA